MCHRVAVKKKKNLKKNVALSKEKLKTPPVEPQKEENKSNPANSL
jgi:hypothetical protein